MAVEFLNINLWDLLINQIFGNFWLCIFGLAALLFILMGILGKMSKITVINYILLFFMVFTAGFGIKWLTTLMSFLLIAWLYYEIKVSTSG